jgi:hypothetical protein
MEEKAKQLNSYRRPQVDIYEMEPADRNQRIMAITVEGDSPNQQLKS